MVKKAKKSTKAASKTKKKSKLVCDSCGMIVSIDKACGCDPCDIVCCGQDMRSMACS